MMQTTPPASVNLSALETPLFRHCCRRSMSPINGTASSSAGSGRTWRETPLASAWPAKMLCAVVRRSDRKKGAGCSSRRPESMLALGGRTGLRSRTAHQSARGRGARSARARRERWARHQSCSGAQKRAQGSPLKVEHVRDDVLHQPDACAQRAEDLRRHARARGRAAVRRRNSVPAC